MEENNELKKFLDEEWYPGKDEEISSEIDIDKYNLSENILYEIIILTSNRIMIKLENNKFSERMQQSNQIEDKFEHSEISSVSMDSDAESEDEDLAKLLQDELQSIILDKLSYLINEQIKASKNSSIDKKKNIEKSITYFEKAIEEICEVGIEKFFAQLNVKRNDENSNEAKQAIINKKSTKTKYKFTFFSSTAKKVQSHFSKNLFKKKL